LCPAFRGDARAVIRRSAVLALAPVAILVAGAVIRDARPIALACLAAGAVVTIARRDASRYAWGACVPIAINLSWALLPMPLADAGGADCANPLSPPATWRAAEAVIVLAAAAALAWRLGTSRADVGLRIPSRPVVLASVAGFVVFGPLALVLGATLARPFFGSFALDLGQPLAVVPALVFAVSNGAMEEIVYRGVFITWTRTAIGVAAAVGLQAILFGLAHAGPDFVGSPLPVMLAMVAGALVAAATAIRTNSLLLPIAAHVALDVPLYFYFACRAA
jgi:uncharacterized protein